MAATEEEVSASIGGLDLENTGLSEPIDSENTGEEVYAYVINTPAFQLIYLNLYDSS